MKTQKYLLRALSLLMALVMFLSLTAGAVVARADGEDPDNGGNTTTPVTYENTIDATRTNGSIMVTKYATTVDVSGMENVPGTATGTVQDKDAVANMKDGGQLIYTPLANAVFSLYQVADANYVMQYYQGLTGQNEEPKVSDFYQEVNSTPQVKFHTVKSDGTVDTGSWANVNATAVETTDENGELTFGSLPVGFYVLVETTPPEQIDNKAQTTLISLPMVNTFGTTNATTNNSAWLYNIRVYPKNDARKSTVTLTKKNGSTPIGDVSFKLYKQDFASDLSFSDDASKWELVYTKSTVNDSNDTAYGTVTFPDLTAGTYGTQYMLIEESAPDGYIADRTPMYFYIDRDKIIHWNDDSDNIFVVDTDVNDTTNTDLSIILSNERPSFEKKVLKNGVEKADATEADWLDDSEYRLDDTITYRLKVHIPEDIAEMETFVITDAPATGIQDHVSSVVMGTLEKCEDDCAEDEHADYCVKASANGFELTLHTANTAVAALKGTDVYVTYTAEMNGKAKIDGEGNENKATLTYSTRTTRPETDPLAKETETIPTYEINDYARVFTFHFDLTKYLDKENGTKPDGVQFHLFDAADNQIRFVGGNGVYRLAVNSDTSSTEILETKAGEITINGLENGDYKLKEIQTVNGYNLLSDQFPIVVDCEEVTDWTTSGSNVAWGTSSREVKVYGSTEITENENSATIINKAGFVLPQTGSMGYLLFCAAGLLLIGGGAAIIFGDRKKVIR